MTEMFLRSCLRPVIRWMVVAFLLLALPAQAVFARGGSRLRWGYIPPGGSPWVNFWSAATPWGLINGWGIPHHSLDAPRMGPGYGSSGLATGPQSPPVDRSVEFPGASSNPTPLLPSFTTPLPSTPYRTEKRFDPPYYHNYDHYWHHGYWGGGQWGWGRWGGPAGIGSFPRWSLGPIYYTSGYGRFRNPFATEPAASRPVFLDYSKPIENIADDDEPGPIAATSEAAAAPEEDSDEESPEEIAKYLVKSPEVKAALKEFDAACNAFKKKEYDEALAKIDEALGQLPYDTPFHEFRGLVLFALGDYQQAAATIYAVLAVSPGWDWTTLSSRYADQEEFVRHLRALEAFHKQHSDSAAAAFLRGYHYVTCRHTGPAVTQLQNAVRLLPDDELLPPLLALVSGDQEKGPEIASTTAGATPAALRPEAGKTSDRAGPPIAKEKLVGAWKANRDDNAGIQLKLRDDGQFVWLATQAGRSRRIAGRYYFDAGVLFLAGGSGTLVGPIQARPEGGFHFNLTENDPHDRGLDFVRER